MKTDNMDRRKFLGRLGAAGMALPLGITGCGNAEKDAPTAGGQPELSGPRVGLCTIAFQERPLDEVLELAARVGFDGVEPWGKPDHLPLTSPDDRVLEIRDKVRSLGLEVSHYGCYVRLGDGQEPAEKDREMDRVISITGMLGTGIARIWAGTKDSEELDERDWRLMVEDGKRFCARAEEAGVLLAMEMHSNSVTNRAAGAARLIELVGSPALRANYQAIFGPGGEDFYQRARTVGPWVVMVHAQNSRAGEHEQCLIEEGDLDFRKLYGILKNEFGFEGYFEVEFVRGRSYEEKVAALEKDCAYLKSIRA
ncbi:MAG: sugar phosphate isomerase/epimerase [Candidatus Glassbacteria bacterium]|nr:sugar phosphate isomerase/epimerase [Candidatus Glassbacteria bacterium]